VTRRSAHLNRAPAWPLLLALGLWLPLSARAFDAIYAFGDSLTDTGNSPPASTNYYQGRYSNGPLWVEYLSTSLGFSYEMSNNFAVSGAQTSDTLTQALQFTAPPNPANALFVVWAGANDFIDSASLTTYNNDAFWNAEIADGVANLSNAVQVLYADGARTALVPNVVDLTRTPDASSFPSFALTYFRNKIVQFNTSLASALVSIQTAHPDLVVIAADAFAQFNQLLANFAAYGFTNTTADALDDPSLTDKSFDGPGADYLFWDEIHPTTKAHALIAQGFQSLLPAATPLRLTVAVAGNTIDITFTGLQVGQAYTLQTSTNLTAWSDLTPVTATNATQQTTLELAPSAVGFFRLQR
jgi:phospholipase/lecithinase/hemolysin